MVYEFMIIILWKKQLLLLHKYRARNSQRPDSQCYEKWRATAYPIYHNPAGYHFSTFVQFLSEGLHDFGKGYHIY